MDSWALCAEGRVRMEVNCPSSLGCPSALLKSDIYLNLRSFGLVIDDLVFVRKRRFEWKDELRAFNSGKPLVSKRQAKLTDSKLCTFGSIEFLVTFTTKGG